jgi:chemotaxis protein MotB
MNPRRPDTTPHRDRWMISYLDMVTILLVFFVAAAARTLAPGGTTRATPIAAPAPAVALPPQVVPAPVAAPAPPPDPLLAKLEEAGIEVRREPRGLVASLPQSILFGPGDDRVAAAALPLIARLASILGDIPNQVIVVGHSDSAPIHSQRFQNNWQLSVARGMRVLELLAQKYQIDEKRLSVSGDGSNRPAEPNDTPEGRALNRRVELVILDAPAPPPAGTPLTNLAPAAD